MSGNVPLKNCIVAFCLLICLVLTGIISAGCLTMLPAVSDKPAGSANGAVAALPATTVPVGAPDGNCGTGRTQCDGFCRDTTLDIANCGGCGLTCPSNAACRNSQCFCNDGYQASGGQCLPLTTISVTTTSNGNGCTGGLSPCPDGFCYCGTCGTRCLKSQTCVDDVCVPPLQQPAAASGICSDGAQHDLQTDPANCGSCGYACLNGQTCSAGTCMGTAAVQCPSGQNSCNGVCKDLASDPRNCGICGRECDSGKGCSSGTCITICGTGASICDGACTYLKTDTRHCGTCSTKCPTGAACNNGVCTCPAGQSACNGVCTNLQSSFTNCGRCGHSCGSPYTQCLMGTCSCPTGQANCRGACVDLSTNLANCGTCGNSCDPGFTCTGGTCKSSVIRVGITPRAIPI